MVGRHGAAAAAHSERRDNAARATPASLERLRLRQWGSRRGGPCTPGPSVRGDRAYSICNRRPENLREAVLLRVKYRPTHALSIEEDW